MEIVSTEYEIADLMASAVGNMWAGLGMLITFTTAYIVAAYLVGKKLPLGQLMVVNVGFAIAWFLASASLVATVTNLRYLVELQGKYEPAPFTMPVFYLLSVSYTHLTLPTKA